MKKILTVLAIAALTVISSTNLQAEGNGQRGNPGYYQKIPPATLKVLLAAPAATGKTAFELAAREINKWVDQKMSNLPKNDRPYVDPLTVALMCDSLVKSYRSGNGTLAEEIAARIPVDLTVEEKISFLESITKAYLAAEAKKK